MGKGFLYPSGPPRSSFNAMKQKEPGKKEIEEKRKNEAKKSWKKLINRNVGRNRGTIAWFQMSESRDRNKDCKRTEKLGLRCVTGYVYGQCFVA